MHYKFNKRFYGSKRERTRERERETERERERDRDRDRERERETEISESTLVFLSKVFSMIWLLVFSKQYCPLFCQIYRIALIPHKYPLTFRDYNRFILSHKKALAKKFLPGDV